MKRFFTIVILLVALVPRSNAQFWAGRDAYGGIIGTTCPSTGFFHTVTVAGHVVGCTPLGTLYLPEGVYVVDRTAGGSTDDQGHNYNTIILAKYGSAPAWADATANRLMQWGFSFLSTNAAAGILPEATDPSYPLDVNGVHSIPHKIPHETQLNSGLYGMINKFWFLSEPNKNTFTARSPRYAALGGFVNGNGFPDYSNTTVLGSEALQELQITGNNAFATIRNSIYNPYMFGVANGDSDYNWFFGAVGSDVFATLPSGHNSDHGGWFSITASPLLSADTGLYKALYQDNVVYIKKRAYNYLLATYGANPAVAGGTSGQSLNTQWGSSYSTLGTSGACFGTYYFPCAVQNPVATYDTANGVKTSFGPTTLAGAVAPLSVQIISGNGTIIAGDNGSGTISGPCINGSITYSTGVSSFTWLATCTGTRAFQRIIGVSGTVTMVYNAASNGQNLQTGCVVGESITISGTVNYNGTYPITACGTSPGNNPGIGSSATGYTIQFAKAGTIAQEATSNMFFSLPTLSTQTLTVKYISNGWQTGTGFLDEDGRSTHSSYLGTHTGFSGLNGTANFNADADQILLLISTDYFKTFSDNIKTVFPNHMRAGPDAFGTWSIPSRCVVLQASAPYIDYMVVGGEAGLTGPMLNFIHNCLGDKMIVTGQYRTANASSAFSFPNSTASRGGSTVTVTTSRNNNANSTSGEVVSMINCSDSTFNDTNPHSITSATSTTIAFTLTGLGATATGCTLYYNDTNVGGFPTQAARGTDFQNVVTALLTTQNSGGVFPVGAYTWWQFTDNWSEQLNWGLVTVQDNALDGNEDVVATGVTCSPPLNSFTSCGGQVANFGDVISPVVSTNHAIDAFLSGLTNCGHCIFGSGTITGSGVVKNP